MKRRHQLSFLPLTLCALAQAELAPSALQVASVAPVSPVVSAVDFSVFYDEEREFRERDQEDDLKDFALFQKTRTYLNYVEDRVGKNEMRILAEQFIKIMLMENDQEGATLYLRMIRALVAGKTMSVAQRDAFIDGVVAAVPGMTGKVYSQTDKDTLKKTLQDLLRRRVTI